MLGLAGIVESFHNSILDCFFAGHPKSYKSEAPVPVSLARGLEV
jgi:hypothetical protein